jgi:hypothetical protein
MLRFMVTGPLGREALDHEWLVADSPLEALHRLHAEALGFDTVRLVDDHLVFADPADQEKSAGVWRVTAFQRNGSRRVEITIPAPVPVAA